MRKTQGLIGPWRGEIICGSSTLANRSISDLWDTGVLTTGGGRCCCVLRTWAQASMKVNCRRHPSAAGRPLVDLGKQIPSMLVSAERFSEQTGPQEASTGDSKTATGRMPSWAGWGRPADFVSLS